MRHASERSTSGSILNQSSQRLRCSDACCRSFALCCCPKVHLEEWNYSGLHTWARVQSFCVTNYQHKSSQLPESLVGVFAECRLLISYIIAEHWRKRLSWWDAARQVQPCHTRGSLSRLWFLEPTVDVIGNSASSVILLGKALTSKHWVGIAKGK